MQLKTLQFLVTDLATAGGDNQGNALVDISAGNDLAVDHHRGLPVIGVVLGEEVRVFRQAQGTDRGRRILRHGGGA